MEIKRRKLFAFAKGSKDDRKVESAGMTSIDKDIIINDPEVSDKEKEYFIIHGSIPQKYRNSSN